MLTAWPVLAVRTAPRPALAGALDLEPSGLVAAALVTPGARPHAGAGGLCRRDATGRQDATERQDATGSSPARRAGHGRWESSRYRRPQRPSAWAAALALCLLASPALAKKPRATTSKAGSVTHEVVAGDTLGGIAKLHACSVSAIQSANDLPSDLIRLGQRLTIPDDCGPTGKAEGRARETIHLVVPGDTLSGIAQKYGVTPASIQSRNKLKGDVIRACKTLKIAAATAARPRELTTYRIDSGDTLDSIARRFRTDLKEISCLNPQKAKHPDRLRIGDTLRLLRYGPANPSETVGRANDGKLVNGEQLPSGAGYFRRRPERSWGTNETIDALLRVIGAVRTAHKKIHDIAVGDLSAKHGGQLAVHKSHQSGRDVDLGLYFAKQPKGGPRAFINALRNPIDMSANWTLLEELVGKSPRTSRVEYVFLDYKLQEKFYTWARKKGVAKSTLDWMFQYPRGKRAMRGVIRHEPGHADHYHIRFKCPPEDHECV